MKRIGIVVAGSAYPMDGFKSELRNLGWFDGESVSFELRAAEGQLHLLPEFASELIGLGVDLIAVIGAVTVRAVRHIRGELQGRRWVRNKHPEGKHQCPLYPQKRTLPRPSFQP